MKKLYRKVAVVLIGGILVSSCGSNTTDPTMSAAKSGMSQEPITASLEIVEQARVSYLGPEGTYTEEATQFFFPDTVTLMPKASVNEAIADVVAGEADYAVIPQENTLGGAVTDYVDALLAEEGVFVVGEVILPISQTLMGVPGASLEDIRLVCSHAQGLAQSETWRKENLPGADTQELGSTAAAASYVAETGDKTIAAVAAPGAAELYGLSVLAENVQITDANKTRFYVLSAMPAQRADLTRAVFAADCEANRLDDIIVEMHKAGLELVTIHDRPDGSRLGAYHYVIEVENGKGISGEVLRKTEAIPEVRCLGSFDVWEK
ncbi:MAG: hypothetical protein J6M66_10325 [Lachnospiraceae bacterium]|nr:hypothetical protein [Lachnospiraceae bacterium]